MMQLFWLRTDPNIPLELINGAGCLLEIFFLIVLARYLRKECLRRGIGKTDMLMLRFPPSMNLVIAIMTFDAGVTLRSFTVWVWRRFFGAGDFSSVEIGALAFGGFLMVIGGLCKIRSVTRPDMGDGPWLASAGAVALFVVATLVFR